MNNLWQFEKIWNETILVDREAREYKPRDIIWASEMGTSFLNRYYNMTAEPITNPKDARILRKFEAGNLFQWVVELVMRKAGLLVMSEHIDRQKASTIVRTNDLLPVWARYDFIGGGKPDYKRALEQINDIKFPTKLQNVALKLIEVFSQQYPEGLQEIVCEVKSVNSLVFWAHIESINVGYFHHRLQLLSQLKGFNYEWGKLIYISKDDLTIKEVFIKKDNPQLNDQWLFDVTTMTRFLKEKTIPPKDPEIIFDELEQKHLINWNIRYSLYFNKIMGVDREKW